jgi:hypothetical protein
MLNSQHVINRRIVHSAKHLYFFQQKRDQMDSYDCDEGKDEKEDNKVYVLGYN